MFVTLVIYVALLEDSTSTMTSDFICEDQPDRTFRIGSSHEFGPMHHPNLYFISIYSIYQVQIGFIHP